MNKELSIKAHHSLKAMDSAKVTHGDSSLRGYSDNQNKEKLSNKQKVSKIKELLKKKEYLNDKKYCCCLLSITIGSYALALIRYGRRYNHALLEDIISTGYLWMASGVTGLIDMRYYAKEEEVQRQIEKQLKDLE